MPTLSTNELLLGIGLVIALAVGAPLVAKVLGILTNDVQPSSLLGTLYQPFVSVAVGVILFEAGLRLSFRDVVPRNQADRRAAGVTRRAPDLARRCRNGGTVLRRTGGRGAVVDRRDPGRLRFVMIAASVSPSEVRSVLGGALALVAVMVLVIRPAVVALTTWGRA